MMTTNYAKFPTALDVEGTSICNLKCPMCPRSQPGFKQHRKHIGHMSDRIFGRLVRELEKHHGQVSWIWFHVGGEPLLDPSFIERVNILAGTGAFVAVSTNGTMLTPKLSRAILQSKLGRLIVSIDSVTKEIYEKVRVGADFDKTMTNVNFLLKEARKSGHRPNIWLQALLMDDTKEGIKAFVDKYGEGNSRAKYQSLQGLSGAKVLLKRHETFAGQVKPRGHGWDKASGTGRRFSCRKPFKRATVLSSGEVTLCCYDIQGRAVLGSLENNSLGGIWKSQPYQDARLGFELAQWQHKKSKEVDNDLFPKLCRGC